MKYKYRSKIKNKSATIVCPRHKKGLAIFGIETYDLLDNKSKPCGVICWKCGKNLPVWKETK